MERPASTLDQNSTGSRGPHRAGGTASVIAPSARRNPCEPLLCQWIYSGLWLGLVFVFLLLCLLLSLKAATSSARGPGSTYLLMLTLRCAVGSCKHCSCPVRVNYCMFSEPLRTPTHTRTHTHAPTPVGRSGILCLSCPSHPSPDPTFTT